MSQFGACCRSLGILVLLALSATRLQAQPTVTLQAEAQDHDRYVLFTFVQDDLPSMQACHYNLFAANQASDLESLPGKGLSIATFFKDLPLVQIIAGPLPRLARKLGKRRLPAPHSVKVYFRTLLSCPQAEDGLGETISVSVNTSERGTLNSIKQFTRSMKHNMRYYQLSS